jgi:hypothetical protein
LPRQLPRYLRAFVIALRMTLRGEQPPPPPHAELRAWMQEAVRLTNTVIQVADRSGLPGSARKQLTFIIDRRQISMETILNGVRYHLTEEYPHVLQHDPVYALTAIYSSNLNDQFRVARLVENLDNPEIKAAVQQLSAWLVAIPSIKPETT